MRVIIVLLSILIFGKMMISYPVALIHGIGDACNFEGVASLTNYLKDKLQEEVKCIEIGNGFITSWFMKFELQAEEACKKIKNDPLFSDKFSIFGISQGSLISRYIIQKCDMPGQVMKYVALDGPQMGIGSLPKITCPVICQWINSLFADIVYTKYLQDNLGPTGYYKDRYSYEKYLEYSSFLADLNNEKKEKNEIYKNRFSQLEMVLLIKNKYDSVIVPRESAWFEFYDKEGINLVSIKDSDFYKSDYLGLRYLDEKNKLQFAEFSGEHVNYTEEELDNFIIPVLK